jgi:hypothetical protein
LGVMVAVGWGGIVGAGVDVGGTVVHVGVGTILGTVDVGVAGGSGVGVAAQEIKRSAEELNRTRRARAVRRVVIMLAPSGISPGAIPALAMWWL